MKVWDHSKIVDLVFLILTKQCSAPETSWAPHWWQDSVPTEYMLVPQEYILVAQEYIMLEHCFATSEVPMRFPELRFVLPESEKRDLQF